MSTIEVTVWGHSAVRFERAGRRLVIDPGGYSDPAVLESAQAVLLTHEHPDHVAVEPLLSALTATDAVAEVWGPATVIARLADAGAPQERLHEVAPGQQLEVAGVAVRVVGGEHALIHPDIPRVANVGYVVEQAALHPGDSFVVEGSPIQLLFLPISAPWLKVAEAVDYLRAMRPQIVVPIHDAVLSDAGRALHDRVIGGLAGDVEYRRLQPGERLTLEPH